MWIGQAANSNGTLTVSAGTVQVNNWFAIGREGGTGTLNLSGGSITKGGANNNHVVVGSLGGKGTVNQSGGSFSTVGSGGIYLGENPTATALWDISGGSVATDETRVSWNGGTNELRVRNSGSWTTGFLNVGEASNNGKGVVNQTGCTITSNTWIAVGIGSGQQ